MNSVYKKIHKVYEKINSFKYKRMNNDQLCRIKYLEKDIEYILNELDIIEKSDIKNSNLSDDIKKRINIDIQNDKMLKKMIPYMLLYTNNI